MSRAWVLLTIPVLGAILALAPGAMPESKIASYATPLVGRTSAQRHNAELGARRLHGVVVAPHAIFSFNKAIGSWTRDRGFVKAPVSFNGQLLPAFGGGVCQTSTTLYNAALLSGMEILERHSHHFAPTYVPAGRDAAVAYSDIDLRFRNPYDFPIRIQCQITRDNLVVTLVGKGSVQTLPLVQQEVLSRTQPVTLVRRNAERTRVRTKGRDGFEVAIYRIWPNERELISHTYYPPMGRLEDVN